MKILDLGNCHFVIATMQLLYRLSVEEVPEDDYMLPLSEAEVNHFFTLTDYHGTLRY